MTSELSIEFDSGRTLRVLVPEDASQLEPYGNGHKVVKITQAALESSLEAAFEMVDLTSRKFRDRFAESAEGELEIGLAFGVSGHLGLASSSAEVNMTIRVRLDGTGENA